MYRKHYQSTPTDYANYTSLRKTPKLQQKAYSFKDPLYESFGNGYLSKANLPFTQKAHQKNQTDHGNQWKANAQVFEEVLEIADKFNLMKSMLQISKPICSPSVLFVNTQNKLKTQMIIQSKAKNQDEDSKILRQNAKKYLTFLEVFRQEDIKYQCGETKAQKNQIDVKINLESRIQKQTLPFSNQSKSLSQINPREKEKASKSGNFHATHLLQNQQTYENNFDHSFAQDNSQTSKEDQSFTNQDYSKYLASYHKGSQITHNSENTDKMFQRIQTPKIYQDHSNQKLNFTSFQQSHPSQIQSRKSNLQSQQFRKFEKSPSKSSSVLQTKNIKINSNLSQRENIHNQKMHRQFKIQEGYTPRKEISIKKEIGRSSSSKIQSFISLNKDKESKQVASKTVKQKIRIGKNFNNEEPSKNLAMRVLDKTSQFQKMLKMASSRINPN